MLRVRIEIVPFGIGQPEVVAEAVIVNTGGADGRPETGDYEYGIWHDGELLRDGEYAGFRRELGVWALLAGILAQEGLGPQDSVRAVYRPARPRGRPRMRDAAADAAAAGLELHARREKLRLSRKDVERMQGTKAETLRAWELGRRSIGFVSQRELEAFYSRLEAGEGW